VRFDRISDCTNIYLAFLSISRDFSFLHSEQTTDCRLSISYLDHCTKYFHLGIRSSSIKARQDYSMVLGVPYRFRALFHNSCVSLVYLLAFATQCVYSIRLLGPHVVWT
jgi:hypothetical protein